MKLLWCFESPDKCKEMMKSLKNSFAMATAMIVKATCASPLRSREEFSNRNTSLKSCLTLFVTFPGVGIDIFLQMFRHSRIQLMNCPSGFTSYRETLDLALNPEGKVDVNFLVPFFIRNNQIEQSLSSIDKAKQKD